MFIVLGSSVWEKTLDRMQVSLNKSNRDVLCAKCWAVMTYELSVIHRKEAATHSEFFYSSKQFCSQEKLIKLAKKYDKMCTINNMKAVEDPYKKRKRYRGFKNQIGVRKIFFTDYISSDEEESVEPEKSTK